MGGDPAEASQGNLDAASWGKETVRAVHRRGSPAATPITIQARCHGATTLDGILEDTAKERTALTCKLSAKNEKGASTMRTPSSERKLNAIQQRSLQPQQQQLLQQPLLLRLLQQQQQPQPLQQP